jgi:hypothetical protein
VRDLVAQGLAAKDFQAASGLRPGLSDTLLGRADRTRRRPPSPPPSEAEIAVKRGGLEGSRPTAFVFGKVPRVPAWRTSRQPSVALEGSSARLGAAAASNIDPKVPFPPRARPYESPGGPEAGPGVSADLGVRLRGTWSEGLTPHLSRVSPHHLSWKPSSGHSLRAGALRAGFGG